MTHHSLHFVVVQVPSQTQMFPMMAMSRMPRSKYSCPLLIFACVTKAMSSLFLVSTQEVLFFKRKTDREEPETLPENCYQPQYNHWILPWSTIFVCFRLCFFRPVIVGLLFLVWGVYQSSFCCGTLKGSLMGSFIFERKKNCIQSKIKTIGEVSDRP